MVLIQYTKFWSVSFGTIGGWKSKHNEGGDDKVSYSRPDTLHMEDVGFLV